MRKQALWGPTCSTLHQLQATQVHRQDWQDLCHHLAMLYVPGGVWVDCLCILPHICPLISYCNSISGVLNVLREREAFLVCKVTEQVWYDALPGPSVHHNLRAPTVYAPREPMKQLSILSRIMVAPAEAFMASAIMSGLFSCHLAIRRQAVVHTSDSQVNMQRQ